MATIIVYFRLGTNVQWKLQAGPSKIITNNIVSPSVQTFNGGEGYQAPFSNFCLTFLEGGREMHNLHLMEEEEGPREEEEYVNRAHHSLQRRIHPSFYSYQPLATQDTHG